MVGIVGSSQYLTSATLANNQGFSAQGVSLLSDVSLSLLDVGRAIAGRNGVGLSANARALNQQFLSSSATNFNVVFSLGVAENNSIEAAQTQIKALKSTATRSVLDRNFQVPERTGDTLSKTVSDARAERVKAAVDDGGLLGSVFGQVLDTKV